MEDFLSTKWTQMDFSYLKITFFPHTDASSPDAMPLKPPALSQRQKHALHSLSPASGESDFETSVRLKPDEKFVVRNLLQQFVPKEEIKKHQSISKLFDTSFLRHTWRKQVQKTKSLCDQDTFKDGPTATSVSAPNSPLCGNYNGRRATDPPQRGHDSDTEESSLSSHTRRATYPHQQRESEEEEREAEWVVLYHDDVSQSDSGLCASFDSSMDIEICKDHVSQGK